MADLVLNRSLLLLKKFMLLQSKGQAEKRWASILKSILINKES